MPDFFAVSPDTEVLGRSMLGVLNSLTEAGLSPEDAGAWRLANNMVEIDPGRWYPQQPYLDFLRATEQKYGAEVLRELGRSVPKTSKFPPEIRTIERGLRTLDVAFQMNHRHGNLGGYLFERLDGNQGIMHCENPYGCDFDMGILEGLMAYVNEPGTHAQILHLQDRPCRKQGGAICLYMLSW